MLACRVRALSLIAALAAAGCGDARPAAHGAEINDCTRCHGYPPATGAHALHATDNGIACTTCHGLNAGGPGHFGAFPPIVQFTGLAVADGATPSYDAATQTCSGVYCHGATLGAGGSLPNLLWTGSISGCSSCHASPPPSPHPVAQVAGTSPPPVCNSCHPTTVDASGHVIPPSQGGTHVNGKLDGGGHEPGFEQPSVHGPQFLAHAAEPSPNSCQQCHGVNYDNPIVPPASGSTPPRSCNICHLNAGWRGGDAAVPGSGWQTNCSFCHGVKSAQTQAGPYDVSQFPTQSSPPDAIAQRLATAPATPPSTAERIGAHGIHLTGSSFSRAFACSVCHDVPSTLSHIHDTRAAVKVLAPGDTTQDPNAYDTTIGNPTSGTCATRCHGSTLASNPSGSRSPVWSFSGIACNGCHGVPPTTQIHEGFSIADTTVCSGCHPTTVKADGTIDTSPAGTHVNGMVETIAGSGTYHPADWALPVNHGNQYLSTVAGVPGSLDCKRCHGASLALCSDCHSSPSNGTGTAWTSWQTNCTFCHGARTPGYTGADLALAAPPDDVSQRLTGTEVPSRTGQHTVHVLGGFIPVGTGALPCSTCHTVPSAIESANHVTADRVAGVAITAAGAFPSLSAGDQAQLPSPLVTYNRSAGTCTGYCHGSTAWGGTNTAMNWADDFSTPIQGCNDCHGQPPPDGKTVVTTTTSGSGQYYNVCPAPGCPNHVFHSRIMNKPRYGYDSCANCHFGSASGTTYDGLHVNGKTDIVYTPSGTSGFKDFTATWDPAAKTCAASCHVDTGTTTVQSW